MGKFLLPFCSPSTAELRLDHPTPQSLVLANVQNAYIENLLSANLPRPPRTLSIIALTIKQ
jgi:hypothetical protein